MTPRIAALIGATGALTVSLSVASIGQTSIIGKNTIMNMQALVNELQLEPAQFDAKRQLELAAGFASERRQETIRQLLADARTALDSPQPDLWALSRRIEMTVDGLLADFRQLKDQRLTFYYETLTPEQQEIVRHALREQLERLEWRLQLLQDLDLG